MDISRDVNPVTYFKSRVADFLKQIHDTYRPVVMSQNGEPMAVLQDPASYQKRVRIVPELWDQGILQYRELINSARGIIHRISENSVYALSVIDSQRDIEDILFKGLTLTNPP